MTHFNSELFTTKNATFILTLGRKKILKMNNFM